ncbi:MAG: tRNA 2-selenouridine(34) synthase MnmH [Desulfurivibrionaceae bacterium]|nr:tRNA 2-selenouridine(34) synthase MnmH [Desulfurivibrionaceae bacterium]
MVDESMASGGESALVEAAAISWASLPRVIDVRSPAEFEAGHIPGAYNVPLFSDAERATVGTLYKQVSRQAALDKGLEIVGPKLAALVKEIREHGGPVPLIYCWRGGMRSASVCGLMQISGQPCQRLAGGYKAFRTHVRQHFAQPARLLLLGGSTGSGKTALLHRLAQDHLQILDLEGVANHKGSAFGHINEKPQPTNEQFENNLFQAWQHLDPSQPILVENESRVIGKVHLPEPLFSQMRAAPLLAIEVPKKERIARLIADYAGTPKAELVEATKRIAKKLGPEKVKRVEEHIQNEAFHQACEILLSYYDIYYYRGVFKRPPELIHHLELEGRDLDRDAALIKAKIASLPSLFGPDRPQ